jgi:prolyl-tRNA synthetase
LLDEIHESMFESARSKMIREVRATTDPAETGDGLNSMHWCGEEDCGHQIEDITGMAILGIPVEFEPVKGNCAICGKPTDQVIYVARSY